MPYVKKYVRSSLDDLISELGLRLNFDGDLNYVLFALCKRYVDPSYNNYKNYCGELEECVAEIRRRITGPYEDEKIKENGDVD